MMMGSRKRGTNPRALGMSLRQRGLNPTRTRDIAKRRAWEARWQEAAEQLEAERWAVAREAEREGWVRKRPRTLPP